MRWSPETERLNFDVPSMVNPMSYDNTVSNTITAKRRTKGVFYESELLFKLEIMRNLQFMERKQGGFLIGEILLCRRPHGPRHLREYGQ